MADGSITTQAETAAARDGLQGEVTSVAAACPRTALEIGVFFDGTYNNAANALQGGGTGSYGTNSGPTNVHLLYQRYKDGTDYDIINENGTGVCRKFRAEYVPGIGTNTGGDDNQYGAAVGMGVTGVEATVARTCLRIGQIINESSPGIEPDEIILDIFGFSRGSAAARLCVNAFRQGWIDYNPIFGDRVRGVLPEGRNVLIRFLGIFDTVASIGAGFDNYNHGLNIHLNEGSQVTHKIFHVTADNEYRVNFRLNENTPGGGTQRGMPGCHGDIGGAYVTNGDQPLIEGTQSYNFATAEQARRFAERVNTGAHPINPAWIEEGWVAPSDLPEAIVAEVSPPRISIMPGMVPVPTYAVTVRRSLNRHWVTPGLGPVALHAMHHNAVQNEVPFRDLPGTGRYALDPALSRLLSVVRDGGSLSAAERAVIVRNYAHISAVPGDLVNIGQPSRDRVRYPNQPGEAV